MLNGEVNKDLYGFVPALGFAEESQHFVRMVFAAGQHLLNDDPSSLRSPGQQTVQAGDITMAGT